MLLKPRTVCLAVCLGASLLLPACSSLSGTQSQRQCEEADKSGFLTFRPSDRLDTERAVRAVRMADDPRSRPSYREQRQARAAVMAAENNKKELAKIGASAVLTNGGASSKADQVKFVAAARALTLEISASENLNFADGASHALTVVVYHLSDRSAIDQLASTPDGMRKLLEGEPFDASVRAIRRLDIQPCQKGTVIIDRAENGRFAALVAGYHQPNSVNGYYAESYPIGQFVQQVDNVLLKSKMLMYTPMPLTLRVNLGDTAMEVVSMDPRHDDQVNSVMLDPHQFAWSR